MKLAGLVEHQLLTPLEERDQRRWLVVTKEIDTILSGKGDPALGFPSVDADVTIGRFCKGHIVSITRQREGPKTDFKYLQNHDQAWVMMFRGPAEGWRLFGRFARKNLFVGLALWPRGACVPFAMYQQRAADMIADWGTRWAAEPLRSANYEGYLSEPFDDRDEP